MNKIKKNILEIKKNISKISLDLNRTIDSVTLMAVSKKQSSENIREAYQAGQKDFGENYLQESISKIHELHDLEIIWHYIGSIQSNKSKLIAENYDWVHSIDKISTLKKINKYRGSVNRKINICIQVNIDAEDTKSGLYMNEVEDFIKGCSSMNWVNIRGLMAIPKYQSDSDLKSKAFKKIKHLFDDLIKKGYKLDTLSIGMSSDYEEAIESGSTIVRIGTAIFGERKK
jgi:pyridoxal phosphate enzyme (YggS family)